MTPKLLPCPFCGSEAELVTSYSYGYEAFMIRCRNNVDNNCTIRTSQVSSRENVIMQWNKQIDHDDAVKYRRLMKSLGNMPTEHPPIWDSRNIGQ